MLFDAIAGRSGSHELRPERRGVCRRGNRHQAGGAGPRAGTGALLIRGCSSKVLHEGPVSKIGSSVGTIAPMRPPGKRFSRWQVTADFGRVDDHYSSLESMLSVHAMHDAAGEAGPAAGRAGRCTPTRDCAAIGAAGRCRFRGRGHSCPGVAENTCMHVLVSCLPKLLQGLGVREDTQVVHPFPQQGRRPSCWLYLPVPSIRVSPHSLPNPYACCMQAELRAQREAHTREIEELCAKRKRQRRWPRSRLFWTPPPRRCVLLPSS